MIQLVTFDLDNTLWETESVVVAAEQALMRWLEKNAPAFAQKLDADARMALRNEVLATQPELRHRVTIAYCRAGAGPAQSGLFRRAGQ